jgi:uncharacterized membrane protein (UPF0182 family)
MRNYPPPPPPPQLPFDNRRPLSLFKLLLVGLLLLGMSSGLGRLYVDQLWFESLGYDAVFWYRLQARAVAFAVSFVATAIVLWGAFRLLLAVTGPARRQFLQVQGRYVEPPTVESIKPLVKWVAIVLGILIGLVLSSQWETLALYLNQPAVAGVTDPIYGKPLGFYFFTLPALGWGSAWLIMVSVVVVLASIVLFGTGMTATLRGISMAASLGMLAVAARLFIARYQLVLADHELFSGMNYVNDHVVSPGMFITTGALLAGAAILISNVTGSIRLLAMGILLPVATQILGGVLLPRYVTTFTVRPNQLASETPYIRHNIDFTRKAFGLDKVEELPFEPRETDAVFDPAKHEATLNNMRLWDWQALQDTLRAIQELRTQYAFADVDIDRYVVDGKVRSMMLATRELDARKLPAESRNWVNNRLIYTHGYGVTMNYASEFTRDGLPRLVLSDMPVESTVPDIQVKRPEIYFGELTNEPVFVKTTQKEFNYSGKDDNYSTYEGTGGIQMGGFFRRMLLAMEVGDLLTVPFSNDIKPESSLLLHRNIVDRATRLAPFLTFDDDPYMVVGEDGALYWMIDAFTTSSRYPYSRHIAVGRKSINYIRNSVKVVIDAYNGNASFYVFDAEDPLIAAYQKMYPDLFRPKTAMPDFLMKHARYPELLFQVQAMLYRSYHVTNEQVFYQREDVWAIAQQSRTQGAAAQSATAEGIEPFFILMTFPGSTNLEFVSILPFTPARRNNMIGWLAARSDGEDYGKLRAYHLPKTRFIDGPLQIQSRIDQDPQLSSQLTLWNQQGSAVIRGNLLVIPMDDVLLFAQPIYLQAKQSPMPALRLIVLATQDRLAYATSFDEALRVLLAGGGGSLAQPTSGPGSTQQQQPGQPQTETAPVAAGAAGASTQVLITRANQALADYRRLTAEGKLAEAGAKLEDLKNTLEQLNRPGAR